MWSWFLTRNRHWRRRRPVAVMRNLRVQHHESWEGRELQWWWRLWGMSFPSNVRTRTAYRTTKTMKGKLIRQTRPFFVNFLSFLSSFFAKWAKSILKFTFDFFVCVSLLHLFLSFFFFVRVWLASIWHRSHFSTAKRPQKQKTKTANRDFARNRVSFQCVQADFWSAQVLWCFWCPVWQKNGEMKKEEDVHWPIVADSIWRQ